MVFVLQNSKIISSNAYFTWIACKITWHESEGNASSAPWMAITISNTWTKWLEAGSKTPRMERLAIRFQVFVLQKLSVHSVWVSGFRIICRRTGSMIPGLTCFRFLDVYTTLQIPPRLLWRPHLQFSQAPKPGWILFSRCSTHMKVAQKEPQI